MEGGPEEGVDGRREWELRRGRGTEIGRGKVKSERKRGRKRRAGERGGREGNGGKGREG
jgi:hypothetical protein